MNTALSSELHIAVISRRQLICVNCEQRETSYTKFLSYLIFAVFSILFPYHVRLSLIIKHLLALLHWVTTVNLVEKG